MQYEEYTELCYGLWGLRLLEGNGERGLSMNEPKGQISKRKELWILHLQQAMVATAATQAV